MSTSTENSTRRAEVLRASPPMFQTRWLDAFSRVHWSVPAFVFVPIVAALLAFAIAEGVVWWAILALVAGGYLFWTFTEYWLHRVVFHFEPEDGIGARLHWIIHGVHHDHPNDPKRLVMPPAVSIPLAALFFGLFMLIFGLPLAFAFTAGFLVGYLTYDLGHYYMHHHIPRSRMGKRLRELHMRHHFQDHERCYGVSVPWWDHVFRTQHRVRAPRN